MAINKVIYGNNTLIDLTSDTATEDKVLSGYIFHKASGEVAVGTASGGGDIPNGKTVTPTDDIQTWLHCAGIFDNNYTTLAEVLNDLTVFNALLSDANACDYMARSTSWAGSSEGLVPVMTSDTAPSGQCSASSVTSGGYDAWRAFDGNDSTNGWCPNISTASLIGAWIKYAFPNQVKVDKIRALQRDSASTDTTYKLEASNDDTNWTTISDSLTITKNSVVTFSDVTTSTKYCYYRITMLTNTVTGTTKGFKFQFYNEGIVTNQNAMQLLGKYDYACDALLSVPTWLEAIGNSEYSEYILKPAIPIMTSNTIPKGTASSDSAHSNYPAYMAFNGTTADGCMAAGTSKVAPWNITYTFDKPIKKPYKFFINTYMASYVLNSKEVAIQLKDSSDNWVTVKSYTGGTSANTTDINETFTVNELNDTYSAIRFYVYSMRVGNANNVYGYQLRELQIYCRVPNNKEKYIPLVPTMTSNTTPSGVASADSEYNNAFHAFDYVWDSSNMGWVPANNSSGHWLKYEFPNPVLVKSFKIGSRYASTDVTFKLQGSNDGSTWDDLTDVITPTPSTSASNYKLVWSEFELEDNTTVYKYYRLYQLSGGIYNSSYGLKLQLYRLQEPEPAIIHCATDDEITIVGDDVETTIYAYGDTATLPSDIPSGLYTFTSAVLSNPSYPDQPYTQNVYITEHTTEIYFMPENMETVLWTNSAPTSNFAQQAVILLETIRDFEYIMVKYRLSTSDSTEKSTIFPQSEIFAGDSGRFYFGGTSTYNLTRLAIYDSDTQFTISDCKTMGNNTTDNSKLIPLEIVGLNKLRTGKKSSRTVTTLWTNPSPSASAGFAAQNVTLSDDVSNYDYIEFEFFQNVAKRDDIVIVAFSPEQLKNKLIGSNWYGSSATIFAGNYYYTRYIRYDSETSMFISSGLKSKSGSSGSTFATSIIPNKIYGIKYE